MSKRKFVTELAFNLASQGILVTHPKDIDKLENQSETITSLSKDCHIYLITKRPRLGFIPDSIHGENGITTGKFYYLRLGKKIEVEFMLRGEPNSPIEYTEYPHRKIVMDPGSKNEIVIPAHLMSLMCNDIEDKKLRDLEVVYVGMSYGNGTRSAKDRLESHSTLQQVLADMSSDEPENEALILLVQYAPPFTIISIDGRDKSLDIKQDRDVVSDLRQQRDLISEKTEIALAEAGLIRYFKPKYNAIYKNNFPDQAHKITESLYDIDFSGFIVEIDTDDVNSRLFSTSVTPSFHHIANYDLHDPKERESFFQILESSSSYIDEK